LKSDSGRKSGITLIGPEKRAYRKVANPTSQNPV
jgi:hypothetical protein